MRALPTAAAALTDLSERDQAILRDVAGGLSPKEIAERIGHSRGRAVPLHRVGPGGDPASAQRRHDARGYARHASRPASPSDIEEFERRFAPPCRPTTRADRR
jgi:hypothetical protein